MYIKQAFNNLHEWWRYLVGFLIIFVASQLGTIPLIVAVFLKKMTNGEDIYSIDESEILTTLSSNLTLFLMLLSFAIGLLAVYFVVRYLHRQRFVTLTTSRKKTDWGRIFFGFGLITITTLVVTTLDFYSILVDYVLIYDLDLF